MEDEKAFIGTLCFVRGGNIKRGWGKVDFQGGKASFSEKLLLVLLRTRRLAHKAPLHPTKT